VVVPEILLRRVLEQVERLCGILYCAGRPIGPGKPLGSRQLPYSLPPFFRANPLPIPLKPSRMLNPPIQLYCTKPAKKAIMLTSSGSHLSTGARAPNAHPSSVAARGRGLQHQCRRVVVSRPSVASSEFELTTAAADGAGAPAAPTAASALVERILADVHGSGECGAARGAIEREFIEQAAENGIGAPTRGDVHQQRSAVRTSNPARPPNLDSNPNTQTQTAASHSLPRRAAA